MSDAAPPLALDFLRTEAGWITFTVQPFAALETIWATHLDDPFPALLSWLEEIASGEREARWSLDEEGQVTEFIFLAKPRLPFASLFTRDRLIGQRFGSDDALSTTATCAVERAALVRSVYGAFRDFATSERYRPEEWESQPGEADSPWHGTALATLRSPLVEDFLGMQ